MRMKESLKDSEGSSLTGNLPVDPGCGSRSEVSRIRSEYEQLLEQNASLKTLEECITASVLYEIERLGEAPVQENAKNDQNVGNKARQAVAKEAVHSGR
ncbi:unnamed protein product [Thlaspi arvense]|uniref:Uncharacterized protein n=1 Tax=Thlaspi arvense TaxID=13288 RepID=A0AAU9RVG7_THLAR|nr:unnamed protein product [Thlaspi arvense]